MEFNKCFVYKENVGLVPKTEDLANIKHLIAEQAIEYLNSLSHCLDPDDPPIENMIDCEDYTLDDSFTIPKMKKPYFGNLSILLYHRRDHIMKYYEPFTLNEDNGHILKNQNHNFLDTLSSMKDGHHHSSSGGGASSHRPSLSGPAGAAGLNAHDLALQHHQHLELVHTLPQDVTYTMAMSYTCLKGDFDQFNPMGVKMKGNLGSVKETSGAESTSNPPSGPSNNQLTHDLSSDDELHQHMGLAELDPQQVEVMNSILKSKNGVSTIVDLSFGMLLVYLQPTPRPEAKKQTFSDLAGNTRRPENPLAHLIDNAVKNANTLGKKEEIIPNGEKMVIRMILANSILTTSFDILNQIFNITKNIYNLIML
jgi:hypothetical protein